MHKKKLFRLSLPDCRFVLLQQKSKHEGSSLSSHQRDGTVYDFFSKKTNINTVHGNEIDIILFSWNFSQFVWIDLLS